MEEKALSNIVFVGSKEKYADSMRRIGGCLRNQKNCVIKTRGKAIYNTVNIVSFLIKKDEKVSVKDIKISSSMFKGEDGKERHIPEIEINLETK